MYVACAFIRLWTHGNLRLEWGNFLKIEKKFISFHNINSVFYFDCWVVFSGCDEVFGVFSTLRQTAAENSGSSVALFHTLLFCIDLNFKLTYKIYSRDKPVFPHFVTESRVCSSIGVTIPWVIASCIPIMEASNIAPFQNWKVIDVQSHQM